MSNEKNTKEEEAIVSDEESQSTDDGPKDAKKATDEMMLKRRVDPKTIDLTIKKEHEGPRKTKAELAFIKRQGETAFDRLSKRAQISHREKVEKFNKQMEELTEFNDIPKVSWTK
uniref:Protein FAM32A n=1 Tax=Globodera rostochiensis TaxID=31243 RepID=A0A914GRB7_GLORO